MADSIAGTIATTLLQNVQTVTVQTAWLPTITLNDPFQPGPPNPLLNLLKPKITIQTVGGAPIVMTPYGDPGASKWPIAAAVGAVGVIAIVWWVWRAWNRR